VAGADEGGAGEAAPEG
jgi:PTH1 family peptidyl-tRNA hydrolase